MIAGAGLAAAAAGLGGSGCSTPHGWHAADSPHHFVPSHSSGDLKHSMSRVRHTHEAHAQVTTSLSDLSAVHVPLAPALVSSHTSDDITHVMSRAMARPRPPSWITVDRSLMLCRMQNQCWCHCDMPFFLGLRSVPLRPSADLKASAFPRAGHELAALA